jgi:multidrug transporter EmrE-like cation transporter
MSLWNTKTVLWSICGLLAYGLGEYFAKKYADSPTWPNGFLSVLGYSTCGACFLPALQAYNTLSALGIAWTAAYALVSVALGLWVFGESLAPAQLVGACLAIAAIILVGA